ncbi:MAG: HEAT repeat domain-containing protein, partial [Pseudomonadales bacterium]
DSQMQIEHVELVEALANNRWADIKKLMDIGEAALPAVKYGMGHPDWRVRRGCAFVVDHVWDVDALERLTLLARDPKKKVRNMAVHALGCDRCKGGVNPIDAVPHLAHAALTDESVRVRRTGTLMLALQSPEKRIARILRKIAAKETDPKALRHAKFGLARYAS